VCRLLETEGYLEAVPRSGNYVRKPKQKNNCALTEPKTNAPLDPAQFVGINAQITELIVKGRQLPIKVNLSRADCAPSIYPGKELQSIMSKVVRTKPNILINMPPNSGNLELRKNLSHRAVANGILIDPEDIVVTQGCIEALNLALRAVTQPTGVVAIEAPTYYGLLQILESLHLKALEIPTSPKTGISLEALETALQSNESISALVVIPNLQNPLGSSMPEENKSKLVALCEKFNIPLIEDDTYSMLENFGTAPRALKSWDKSGNVIHCASLHKVMAPGLRLGWITAGKWHKRVEMLKYVQSQNNEDLPQQVASKFIESPDFERYLKRLRLALSNQRAEVTACILDHFPEGTKVNEPNGGLFLWVELPNNIDSIELFEVCLAEQILIAPGAMFANSNQFKNFVRINCGWPFSSEIERTLKRIGALCKQMQLAG
jgi:DNA-binding transcriptional MocR family regulator